VVRAVLWLAVAGLIALVIALVSGSTPMAVVVVALAAAGIVLLLRDWRSDRAVDSDAGSESPAAEFETGASGAPLSPDEFSPDISTDPDGPSSDARAD
jgi:membrane protein implicated in regulation of membrane protease activity